MSKFSIILIFLSLSFQFSILYGKEVKYLNRSPRGLLLGDAYTAVADDEYTLFYNPAAMGRNSGFSITPLNVDVGVPNILAYEDKTKNFPKTDAVAIADRVMGIPIHLHAGIAPGFKFGTFGLSMLANTTTNITLHNKTHPTLDVDHRYDRGFTMGYAHTFGKGGPKTGSPREQFKRKKNKIKDADFQSIGVGFKYIKREGMDRSFPLFGTELLNIISQSNKDIAEIKKSLGVSEGRGIGFDAGYEKVLIKGSSQFTFGVSILDIADTRFTRTDGLYEVTSQPMSVNTGVAWKQDFLLFHYQFSFDLHPINQGIDYGRMMHAGFEFGIPVVSFLAGYNGGYLSYGACVDLYVFRILAGFYGQEVATDFRQEESKRAIIYINLLEIDIDV